MHSRPLFSPDDRTPLQQALSRRVLQVVTLGFALLLSIGTLMLAALAIFEPSASSSYPNRLISIGGASASFIVAYWLTYRQNERLAIVLSMAVTHLVVANVMFQHQFGIHAPIVPMLILLIYLAGLVCGRREAWLLAATSITLFVAAWLAERNAWIVIPQEIAAPSFSTIRLIAYATLALISAWLVVHFGDAFRSALSDAERATDDARQKTTKLQTISDATPVSIVEWSADETCLFGNARFARFVGRPLDEVVGKTYAELLPIDGAELSVARLRQAISGEPQSYQVSGMIEGAEQSYLIRYTPMHDRDRVRSVLAVGVDVTELHAMEKALAERTRQAEAASVAKSQFLATMSHELRTPLNGILGNAELLSLPDLSEEERQASLDSIATSGNNLLTLLNRVLDLANIESGTVTLRREEFNLAAMLGDVRAAHAGRAQDKGLSLALDYDTAISWTVLGDPQRVHQMIRLLLDNALKFSSAGQVVLGLSHPAPPNASLVQINVRDQGVGIAAGDIGKLFQSFIQVDGSASRRYEGAGLGLVMVRRLAELMGGEVGVESEPGVGSHFWIRLRLDAVMEPTL